MRKIKLTVVIAYPRVRPITGANAQHYPLMQRIENGCAEISKLPLPATRSGPKAAPFRPRQKRRSEPSNRYVRLDRWARPSSTGPPCRSPIRLFEGGMIL
jgi:hypothetical protein